MTFYEIEAEFPNKRAFVKGEFKDFPIDREIVVRDSNDCYYNAVVETRTLGGVVVRVTELILD